MFNELLRYADPDFHLRCRILLNDIKCFEKVVGLFYNELRKLNYSQLIWKIQIDTYNRELERYGSSLIEDTESFFCVDSECVLTIIKKLNGNENYRWMIALKLIDGLLSDFGMSIEKKQKIMKEMGDMLKKEFGFNKYNSKQFNMKFRANKKYIETVLNNSFKEKDFVSLLLPIRRRTKEIMLIINSFNKKIIQERRVENLLKSYLHMMLNRLFRSKNRQHELVLYDFMFRYYSSQIAKEYYK